nr:reverse transcriptase domain-containing protein [Tanacetum cinerariifolium]
RQDNVVDEDVDEKPVQDLVLNVDNVFQDDNCDAFDSNVDEVPTVHTMLMANISSADPVYDEAVEKTTFTCPYETFAYRRMPFALCNAPGTFQRCMLAIFHDMVEKTMDVFMDDFSIFGNSFENCLSRLDKMLQRCEDTNLCLNWEKSYFMVKEGIILGHKISKNEIEVDRAKVNVIAKLPHPTTIKGAVVGQRHEKHFRPIHYASKTMTDEESNYTTTEKEMLAVVFGTPRAIISDRGTHFCNDQFAKVMLKYGVTHRLFTAYHPQTNGQVEENLKPAGVDLSLSPKFFHMARLSYLKLTGLISNVNKAQRVFSKAMRGNNQAHIFPISGYDQLGKKILDLVEPEIRTIVEMADNRTMAQMLQAPIEGYEDAIVIPPINANNFELKQTVINLVQSNQFTEGEARIWLDKEPSRSILTWGDLVSKFINQFFPPSKTTYLRNEITNFLQKPNEMFNEAWERFKDLLRQCPHHGFSESHQLDTFYNALNPNDQDARDSAAGGNFLDKIPRECLSIIESKSNVRYSRSRIIDSRANTNVLPSFSSPSNSFDLQQIAASLEDKLEICMNRFEKSLNEMKASFVTPTAPIKAVEEVWVTCGANHSYNHCLLTRGNKFLVFHDNIQQFQTAAVGNFIQENRHQNISSQMRPPGFNQPNQHNNQNRYQGNNFNSNQNRQNNQGIVHQNTPQRALTYQAPVSQNSELNSRFEAYTNANNANVNNLQMKFDNFQKNQQDFQKKFEQKQDDFQNQMMNFISGMSYKEPSIPPPGVEQQEPTEATKHTELPSTEDIQPPPLNPQPLQNHPSLDITLSLSPITPLDHIHDTSSPPSPPQPQLPIMDSSPADVPGYLFIVTAVYSKNRCFSLQLSSKAGEILVLLPTGRFKCKEMSEEDVFMVSLIFNVEAECEKLLTCNMDIGFINVLKYDTEPYSQSTTTPPSTYVPPYLADNAYLDSGLSPTDNLIKNLTNTLALLTQSYKTFLPQTNNRLRTSSNTRNQDIAQDGRVVVQNV